MKTNIGLEFCVTQIVNIAASLNKNPTPLFNFKRLFILFFCSHASYSLL